MTDIWKNGREDRYPLERVTEGYGTIDTNHAQIHAGNGFSLKGTVAVAQAKVAVFEITVPAGTYVHLQGFDFASDSGPASVSFIEDATLTSAVGASTLTPKNHHRMSANTSDLTIKVLADAAVTNGAAAETLATLPLYGTGAGANKVAAETKAAEEYILKSGETYVIAVSHSVAGTCNLGYKLFWYEESAY